MTDDDRHGTHPVTVDREIWNLLYAARTPGLGMDTSNTTFHANGTVTFLLSDDNLERLEASKLQGETIADALGRILRAVSGKKPH